MTTDITYEDLAQAVFPKSDLKSCPFCGKEPLTYGTINEDRGNYVANISCVDCLVTMVVCLKIDKKQEAIKKVKEKWNERA